MPKRVQYTNNDMGSTWWVKKGKEIMYGGYTGPVCPGRRLLSSREDQVCLAQLDNRSGPGRAGVNVTKLRLMNKKACLMLSKAGVVHVIQKLQWVLIIFYYMYFVERGLEKQSRENYFKRKIFKIVEFFNVIYHSHLTTDNSISTHKGYWADLSLRLEKAICWMKCMGPIVPVP